MSDPSDSEADDWLAVELEILELDSASSSDGEDVDGNEADDEYESEEEDSEGESEEEELDDRVLRELNREQQPAPVHRTLRELREELRVAQPWQAAGIVRRAIILSPEIRSLFQGHWTPSDDNKENEP